MDQTLLNHKQAAHLCGMSQASFYRLVRHNLPVVRLGPGMVRFRSADLQAFINARVEAVTTPSGTDDHG